MTPEQYAKVKEVFAEAIDVPGGERDGYVQDHCGSDPAIMKEVLSLLRHHGEETILEVETRIQAANQGQLGDPAASLETTRSLASQSILVEPPKQKFDPYLVLSEVWDDNRQILRRRLTVIALILASLMAISTLRLFTYHYQEWGYGVRILAVVVSLLCAWLLHHNRDLSLTQIRIAELVIMANVGILAVVIDVRLMIEAAANVDEATLISVNNWHYFAWTLLIFVYGVFMPNRWQRAAAILIPVAAIPSVVSIVVSLWDPKVAALLNEDRFGQPMPTPFVAAGISIYAAHMINGARMSAFQARQLAQYHIKRLVGEGGMGQVFEAEHLLLKRDCAIKLIQPELCIDSRALKRFEREVRATAKLTHPHTIEVYDYGQTKDDVFFFAMELLPGLNLRELVRTTGPLPACRAVHFLVQVCGALSEAHHAGLIHRDIKPANVFASQRGGIYDYTKLLDFGVVREIEVDPALGKTSEIVAGTPTYMSPEQITAPGKIDARSDIYSMGAVAYYLLTGRPPLTGDSPMEVMLLQVSRVPEPPSSTGVSIPKDLEAVVMRCLNKEVEDRFASAQDLKDALLDCQCAAEWTEKDAANWWRQHGLCEPAAGELESTVGRTPAS